MRFKNILILTIIIVGIITGLIFVAKPDNRELLWFEQCDAAVKKINWNSSNVQCQILNAFPIDSFGCPNEVFIIRENINSVRYEIRSSGPDKTWRTTDDYIYNYSINWQ